MCKSCAHNKSKSRRAEVLIESPIKPGRIVLVSPKTWIGSSLVVLLLWYWKQLYFSPSFVDNHLISDNRTILLFFYPDMFNWRSSLKIQTLLKNVTSTFDDFPNLAECKSCSYILQFLLTIQKISINIYTCACSCRVLEKSSCNTNMDIESLQYIYSMLASSSPRRLHKAMEFLCSITKLCNHSSDFYI